MTLSDEKLTAFMDGELPDAEMEEIAQALESDESLVERLIALREADGWLRSRYDALDEKPISAVTEETARQLVEKLGEATPANVVPLGAKSARKTAWNGRWTVPAVAASVALLVGMGVGQLLGPDPVNLPGAGDPLLTAGQVSPGSPLYAALETSVSGDGLSPAGQGAPTITPLSLFETHSGQYCREYEVRAANVTARGLACRNTGTWNVAVSLVTPNTGSDAPGGYDTASSSASSAIDALILDRIAGDILTRDDERAILENWSK